MDDSHAPLSQRAQIASEVDSQLGSSLALVGAELPIFPPQAGLAGSIAHAALAPRSSAAELGRDIIASIVPVLAADPRDSVEDRIASRIAGSIGEAAFARFFGTPGAGRHMALAGGELSVAAPSIFAAALLDRRFKDMLMAAAMAETGLERVSVRFIVTEASAAERLADHAPVRPSPLVRRVTHAQQVREVSAERYALDQFIVGRSSRLALDATIRFVQMPRSSSLSVRQGPSILTIVGPCGVGKSHLLSGASGLAIETDAASIVKVTTGEAFVGTFVSAVTGTSTGKTARVDSLRRDHRSADLLCIDDLAAIADKPATQTELLHTIDAVTSRGGRVMVTLPDYPRKIRGLGEAIISRLVGGMVATLETPDRETSQRIAISIAARHGLTLDDAAAAFIAAGGGDGHAGAGRSIAASLASVRLASAREMEGLIIKVDAVRRLLGGLGAPTPTGFGASGGRIGLVGVQRALDVAVGRSPMQGESSQHSGASGIRPPVRFHQILTTVCRAVGVSPDDVLAKGRPAPVVLARSVSVFMARKLTKMSYPEIATSLARPNHSTVITAYQRVVVAIAVGEVAAMAGAAAGESLTVAALVDRLTHELGR